MNQEFNIALTAVGRRVELVELLKNSLAKQGYAGKIIGLDCQPALAPAAYACDEAFILPKVTEPHYIKALYEVCQAVQVDVLIPLYEPEFMLLDRQIAALAELGTTLVLSPRSALEICQDKLKTCRFLQQQGMLTPDTLALSLLQREPAKALTVQEWFSRYGGCILKPRSSMGSAGVMKVVDEADLGSVMLRLQQQQADWEQWIIQPCLNGTEYTIDAFADWSGNLISAVPRERLEVRSGEVVKSRTVAWPDWLNELEQITRSLQLVGPLTFQGFEQQGRFHWLEINPRFGGGVPLAIRAGVDYGKLLVQLAKREKLVPQLKRYETGLVMLRYDQSLFIKEPCHDSGI